MKVLTANNNDIETERTIYIVLSNGDQFSLKEDIEGKLEVSKSFSEKGKDSISVMPRYSNQITVE